MAVEMVLNSLSLHFPVIQRDVARNLMTDLIQVLSTARIYGLKTLHTQENLYDLMLSPNYPVAAWLNDREVEQEERIFFRSRQVNTSSPIIIKDSTIQNENSLTDFRYQGEPAYTLGIAYLLNALAVSFNSESRWNSDSLNLEVIKLDTDSETGEIILRTSVERLIHASRREHILSHEQEIQNRLPVEPWNSQDKLLPCYITVNGKNPLNEWLDSLDNTAKTVMITRLTRVKQGNLGDYKPVGEGVCEFRIDYGPGYRIYFVKDTSEQLLLLYGGDKGTQEQDILKAKQYWREHKKLYYK